VGAGLLAADLESDGPYAGAADRWVHEQLCGGCLARAPEDDGLCGHCIAALLAGSPEARYT
jgi:hypothetical protein